MPAGLDSPSALQSVSFPTGAAPLPEGEAKMRKVGYLLLLGSVISMIAAGILWPKATGEDGLPIYLGIGGGVAFLIGLLSLLLAPDAPRDDEEWDDEEDEGEYSPYDEYEDEDELEYEEELR